jgi:hypothetical protein
MSANLLADSHLRPLKGITKVRPDPTLVDVWVVEATAKALVLEWRTRSAGQGFLRFARRDRQIFCDNQNRSKDFARGVLLKALGCSRAAYWPDLLRAHGGVDGLLDAATPLNPW